MKSPTRLEAERLCKEMPDVATRTIARKLATSHKTTVEAARTLVRTVRGNRGNARRPHATSPRPNQPAGYVPECPPSLVNEWTPFDLGNDISVAVLSDIHIPFHHVKNLNFAVKFCKDRKPNVLLLNGDFADFYDCSRFEKDPSKRDLLGEIEAVRKGLEWLRHEFKKARIVLKLGNHDERWQKWLWNRAPEISSSPRMDVKEWIDADKYGVEVVGDQRPIMIGRLPVMHGHELGKSGVAAPVNPARGVFMRTISTMLIGHGHRTSHHVESDWRHKEISCWSTGCLCGMYPEYARVNKWNAGFAFVTADRGGEFAVENLRVGLDSQLYR